MIESIKLRLKRINETESETKTSSGKKVTFALAGFDETHSVEWALTLRAAEAMPDSYIDEVGKRIGDTVRVSLGKSAHQAEL